MKPKIRLEDIKELKIESKVFDEKTLSVIFKLLDRKIIGSVESTIKEGKESVILSAKDKNNKWLALKIYRTFHCDFKSMWKHLAVDPRFKSLKKNRRAIVYNWCKREFRNLKIAFANGVLCPEPIAFKENVLVISFIGKDGKPTPRLIDVILNEEDLEIVYKLVLKEMEKLAKVKLIHTDLSAYNVLFFGIPYLIDFSQGVTTKHPLAKDFLKRDIENINSYFEKFGVKVKSPEELFDNLSKIMGLE